MTAQETLDRLRSLHSTLQCLEMDFYDIRSEIVRQLDHELSKALHKQWQINGNFE